MTIKDLEIKSYILNKNGKRTGRCTVSKLDLYEGVIMTDIGLRIHTVENRFTTLSSDRESGIKFISGSNLAHIDQRQNGELTNAMVFEGHFQMIVRREGEKSIEQVIDGDCPKLIF